MKRFRDLLREYIDEIAENGFPEAHRLEYFMNNLRKAADSEFVGDKALQERMRYSLESYYKRALSKTRLKKTNPNMDGFTITRIMPELQLELDRRILANASMIKLNREQAIDKTLQRFSGWMSSVPVNGSDAINKRDVLEDIAKTNTQLKYEIRRREIDQGHKLMASIDATIAEQSGAIAMQWSSHWRQPGYDYRPDHKERDGKVYAIKGSWAYEQGLINKGAGFVGDMTAPAEEPYCRCNGIYLRHLRQLPEDMFTEKGKRTLAEARAA